MPVVSITEAAKLAGKSRQTMYRYIDDGKISTTETPGGERGIDTSELLRVFGVLQPLHTDQQEEVAQRHNPSNTDVNIVTVLTEQLERERQRADRAEAQNQELQKELIKTKDDMLELYNRLLPAAATVTAKKRGRLKRAMTALFGKDEDE